LHLTGTGQTSVEVSLSTIMDCIQLALGRVQLGVFEQGSGLYSMAWTDFSRGISEHDNLLSGAAEGRRFL
jgi:hypothetical protein